MADHFPDATKKVDCISREAALACFHDWIDRYGHEHSADEMTEYQRIEELPAADVRPVVRGEWKNAHPSSPLLDGGGPPYCSVCGKEAPLRSVEVNQWKLERGSLSGPEVVYKTKCFLSNFCPNCGADMRGPQMLKNASQNADNDVMMPAT